MPARSRVRSFIAESGPSFERICGRRVDSFMNPLSYVVPFLWIGISLKLGEIVNDRALNLDLFQGFEESVVDLYSAVRHGYLRRREQLIKE